MFFLASPKSASLGIISSTTLQFRRMFSGLRSLCTMLRSCRYRTALQMSPKRRRATSSRKQPCSRMYWSRSPPCRSSIARKSCVSVSNHSWNLTMPGWSRLVSTSASLLSERCDSRLFWKFMNFFLSMTFTAYFSPTSIWTPSRTSLKLPLPKSVRMSQCSWTHCSVTWCRLRAPCSAAARSAGRIFATGIEPAGASAPAAAAAAWGSLLGSLVCPASLKMNTANGSFFVSFGCTQIEIESPCWSARVSPFFIQLSLHQQPFGLSSSMKYRKHPSR
mmetsp:Transcript_59194/g.155882  ORF Transcript_59194/g.155882 Transcript_59194/m.155882 type:complete len:276 (+) Transcript_59194:688-1515(+)